MQLKIQSLRAEDELLGMNKYVLLQNEKQIIDIGNLGVYLFLAN